MFTIKVQDNCQQMDPLWHGLQPRMCAGLSKAGKIENLEILGAFISTAVRRFFPGSAFHGDIARQRGALWLFQWNCQFMCDSPPHGISKLLLQV